MSAKTHKGKTGGGWLKTARAGMSQAGIPEVWIDNCTTAHLTDGGELVMANMYGIVCILELSARAERKLQRLIDSTEALCG